MPRQQRWRWPTPEERALVERDMLRQTVFPWDPRSAAASRAAPSRVVREEAQPILLYGWDEDNTQMIAFGHVGGAVGQYAGNPTKPE